MFRRCLSFLCQYSISHDDRTSMYKKDASSCYALTITMYDVSVFVHKRLSSQPKVTGPRMFFSTGQIY